MTEAQAAVIVALITAIGTLIATNFKDIVELFSKSSRNVSGDWLVVSRRPTDNQWVGDYDLRLKQRGISVKGEMSAIRVREGASLLRYTWSGKVRGDYLTYDCDCEDSSAFLISTGLLHIHAGGKKMTGFFVANRGSDAPQRTWIGSAELTAKQ